MEGIRCIVNVDLIHPRKKMAALHFTTIPCEPYTAHKVQGKPYFLIIRPCANDIVYGRFKDVRTLLHYL